MQESGGSGSALSHLWKTRIYMVQELTSGHKAGTCIPPPHTDTQKKGRMKEKRRNRCR